MKIIRFPARFFMSPTGSRYLGEMKTSANFYEMANAPFNVIIE